MLAANLITDHLAYDCIMIDYADDYECPAGTMTTLGMAVEACMLMDDAAQAAYARIYGHPWQSLSDIQASEIEAAAASLEYDGNVTHTASPRALRKK